MANMRPGSTTDDYRRALDGEGELGSLGYEWSDKPHRLVYDLCGEIDRLRSSRNEVIEMCAKEADAMAKSLRVYRDHFYVAEHVEALAKSIRSLKDHSNGCD